MLFTYNSPEMGNITILLFLYFSMLSHITIIRIMFCYVMLFCYKRVELFEHAAYPIAFVYYVEPCRKNIQKSTSRDPHPGRSCGTKGEGKDILVEV